MESIRVGQHIVTCFACLFIASVIISCNHFQKNHSHQQTSDKSIARGKQLAAQYCQSCHMLPDPALLDAKNWENGVLPGMGPRLGIFNIGFKAYPSSRYDRDLDSNYYPKAPVMPIEDWQSIIDYYTAISPDSLPSITRKIPIQQATDLFSILTPARNGPPATCLVKIDTMFGGPQLFTADMLSKKIYRYQADLSIADSLSLPGPIVDIHRSGDSMLACNIGIMNPNNGKHGSAGNIFFGTGKHMHADSTPLFNNLARPVQVTAADFNRDKKTDFLVCEFGNLTGALSWMENTGNGQFSRHVIRALPGAIKAYIEDVNKDGLPDIWVLFAQAEEGIFLFINQGNGKFAQEEVLRFQPIFGSSGFEMDDFNKDGHPDILYTCGDNADYSPVLKPYHGIYIYLNDGTNHFKERYFFPMNGCFKAMAKDFNGDGNLDIAAISFFGDYNHHPEESFIYLENKAGFDFQPWSVPGTENGRWLTMDAGDMDGDGKPDIVLGNFSIAPSTSAQSNKWKNAPSFIVLKNIMKKSK